MQEICKIEPIFLKERYEFRDIIVEVVQTIGNGLCSLDIKKALNIQGNIIGLEFITGIFTNRTGLSCLQLVLGEIGCYNFSSEDFVEDKVYYLEFSVDIETARGILKSQDEDRIAAVKLFNQAKQMKNFKTI